MREITYENAINIFTDGSSKQNPRRGGMGIRYVTIDEESGEEVWEDECPMGYKGATNNQMELLACTLGLKGMRSRFNINAFQSIYISTDSRYVCDHHEIAMHQWARNHWRNRYGRPVENAELWKDFIKEKTSLYLPVRVRWVKGHWRKNKHNWAVDRLAQTSAEGPLNPPLAVVSVRKKRTSGTVKVGGISMRGQVFDIRIITSEKMQPQRVWKYKYEVLSEDDRDFGAVDIIFSESSSSDGHPLRDGHHYRVKVNRDTKYPRIVEVFEELDR